MFNITHPKNIANVSNCLFTELCIRIIKENSDKHTKNFINFLYK